MKRKTAPFRYKQHCEKLGISVYKSAQVLGIGLRSAQAYATDEREVPKVVAIALRAMVRLGTIDV